MRWLESVVSGGPEDISQFYRLSEGLTKLKKLENGRPFSFAKVQVSRVVDASPLNKETIPLKIVSDIKAVAAAFDFVAT